MNSYVYFVRPIGQDGPVKIGCSTNTVERLKALMSWSPLQLEIAATVEGDFALERRIHGLFRADHTRREWFMASEGLLDMIARLAAGEPIGSIIDLTAPMIRFRTRAPRKLFTPEQRRALSYQHRLRWAFKPLWDTTDRRYKPDDVTEILARWYRDEVVPTADELKRIEEVIADPRAHAVTWEMMYPDLTDDAEDEDQIELVAA